MQSKYFNIGPILYAYVEMKNGKALEFKIEGKKAFIKQTKLTFQQELEIMDLFFYSEITKEEFEQEFKYTHFVDSVAELVENTEIEQPN